MQRTVFRYELTGNQETRQRRQEVGKQRQKSVSGHGLTGNRQPLDVVTLKLVKEPGLD